LHTAQAAAGTTAQSIAEQGVPGFVSTPWFGIVTTAGTPGAVVEKLSAAINETLRTTAAQVRFLDMGVELRPNSPQAFERYISAETVKWKEVVCRHPMAALLQGLC
jgi:tripartite-type tricarboxylate transporter receptor subunit TctC